MKNTLRTLAAAGLLLALSLVPMGAQTNMNAEAVPNGKATEIERRMAQDRFEYELKKAEIERSAARDKLEAEKNIAINRTDKHWSITHDLAWNSWVLVVIAAFIFGHFKNKRRHETIRFMIEKGVPVTPEVLAGLNRRDRRRASTKFDPYGTLAWGITLVAVGVGVLIVAGKAGWIVILIGVANLIIWLVEVLTNSNETPSK